MNAPTLLRLIRSTPVARCEKAVAGRDLAEWELCIDAIKHSEVAPSERLGQFIVAFLVALALPLSAAGAQPSSIGSEAVWPRPQNWTFDIGPGVVRAPRFEVPTIASCRWLVCYDAPFLPAKVELQRDLGGSNGLVFDALLDGMARVTDSIFLSDGHRLSVTDGTFNQEYFGINATQSFNSGYAQYISNPAYAVLDSGQVRSGASPKGSTASHLEPGIGSPTLRPSARDVIDGAAEGGGVVGRFRVMYDADVVGLRRHFLDERDPFTADVCRGGVAQKFVNQTATTRVS